MNILYLFLVFLTFLLLVSSKFVKSTYKLRKITSTEWIYVSKFSMKEGTGTYKVSAYFPRKLK